MIWLIGCKGMLGTEIARQLTENKIDFVGTDIDVDITNPQALADFAKGKEISYIINCSAYTAVDKAESDSDFAKKLNEDGPRNIANLANQIHAKMIHISTDEDVPYGTYHCTDLGEITWWDFTNEIKKQGIEAGLITNRDCVVNPCATSEYPTPAKRPAYSVLCKDKIQKALGITLPDWKESLKKFIDSDLFDKSRII